MRSLAICSLLGLATSVLAQPHELAISAQQRRETLQFVQSLYDPVSGVFRVVPKGPPSLRALNGSVRVYRYLNADELDITYPDRIKARNYLLQCYNPLTGGFAEPGDEANVTLTSVAIMAAMEFDVPRTKIKLAMEYLKKNAKTFEEIRIGAAAVEAWGVKQCPFDLKPWHEFVDKVAENQKIANLQDGGARVIGSHAALKLRLNAELPQNNTVLASLQEGQRKDGGWGKMGAKSSDLETTYRVMRALYLLKAKPADPAALAAFLAKCRNADGGYGVQPGDPSSLSGVYYFATIQHWLIAK